MKKRLKHAWSCLWQRTGLLGQGLRLRESAPGRRRCAILMFHRVVPREARDRVHSLAEILVFADTFERQMRFLSEHYRVIPLRDLVRALRERGELPPRSAVITFDDGWEDNYLHAFPVLERYRLPATIFLTAGYVNTQRLFWQERVLLLAGALSGSPERLKQCFRDHNLADCCPLADALAGGGDRGAARLALIKRLKPAGDAAVAGLVAGLEAACSGQRVPPRDHAFLSWRQVEAMRGPLVGYGCHGLNHLPLDGCDDATLRQELQSSKALLEQRLGAPVDALAYPNGNYDRRTIELAAASGYAAGLTVEEGLNTPRADPYRLRRINMCEQRVTDGKGRFSPELFAARLAGLI